MAAKRAAVVADFEKYVVDGLEQRGASLTIPASIFAQMLIATADAVELGSQLDDVDLFRAALEMYMSATKLPDAN